MIAIHPAPFFIFAGLALAFALSVVLMKNPVSSAFSLVLVFFSFAGIYAVFDAHLIAALQILVYAGAIMVLFIFVIMLLNADEPSFDIEKTHPVIRMTSITLGVALWLGMVIVHFKASKTLIPAGLKGYVGRFASDQVIAAGGNSKLLSKLMFSEYILPFELTSILLLAAIVGAVAIAKRKQGGKQNG